MAEKDSNRPYTMDDLRTAVHELDYARGQLEDTRKTLKRNRDAVKSFEKEEQEREAEVARRENAVKKIAGHLEK